MIPDETLLAVAREAKFKAHRAGNHTDGIILIIGTYFPTSSNIHILGGVYRLLPVHYFINLA